MSTDVYKYRLTELSGGDGEIWIICRDFPGTDNKWVEGVPESGYLLSTDGRVKTDGIGHHCIAGSAGSQEVLVLRGAEWSEDRKSGDAELFLSQNTSNFYRWQLVDKSTVP